MVIYEFEIKSYVNFIFDLRMVLILFNVCAFSNMFPLY